MSFTFERVGSRPANQRKGLGPETLAVLATLDTGEALRFPGLNKGDHVKLRIMFQNACRRRNLALRETRNESGSFFWVERRPRQEER